MPVLEETNTFADAFARFEGALNGDRGSWLNGLRRRGFERFSALGLPTTRDESFRFTNVSAIGRTPYERAPEGANVTSADLARLVPALDGPRLVFVDGRFTPSLSDTGSVAEGVRLESLAAVLEREPDALAARLGRLAGSDLAAFAALNTAFLEDGAFVHIGPGVVLDEPISLVFVQTDHGRPAATYPRTLIVAEEGSSASVVEAYAGPDGAATFTNALTEIFVAGEAEFHHAKVQRESARGHHVASTFIAQGGRSNFTSHAVTLGSALARNDISLRFDGEYSEGTLNGLFLADGDRHMDTHTLIDHAQPNCNSRQVYRGILDDTSHGVFAGRIIVRQDAQKTDAQQNSRNLLLSKDAMANALPQLEIFADDVKCTHGATVGALDENAIFYLQARGIPEPAARGLLTHAFAGVVLDTIPIEGLKSRLTEELLERFTGSGRL